MLDQRVSGDRRLSERRIAQIREATDHIGRGTNVDALLGKEHPGWSRHWRYQEEIEVEGHSAMYKWRKEDRA